MNQDPERPTRGRHFSLLLVAIALLLTTYPMAAAGGGARLVFQATFDLVLVAGLWSMRWSRGWLLPGATLVAIAFVTYWGGALLEQSTFWQHQVVASVGMLSHALFLAVLVLYILRDLFADPEVSSDRLCGSVSAYLLLGIAWGFAHTSLELLEPGSYDVPDALVSSTEAVGAARSAVLFYYSIVTLTTLGFGDISPVSPFAQMLTMWEAVIGQVYLTILVARLVGLHVGRLQSSLQDRDR